MKNNFRNNHTLQILKNFNLENIPLDAYLSSYFRSNKSIGSKDRKAIAEKIYKIIRHLGLIDYHLNPPISWEDRIDLLESLNISEKEADPSIISHIRVSFPKNYFEKIKNGFGEEKALEICSISNTKAPATIRVNSSKISRDELFEKWKGIFDISKCQNSTGITFNKKINFFLLEEFKNGFFEIQDEGSQIIADLMDVKKKDLVLDFCAGSGGKTLAFSPKMENQGQIYLYDIRSHALVEARKRLKRAGIQNAQTITFDTLKNLQEKMDWVLLDVPCSGSGTLRRNPDLKWKFQEKNFQTLLQTQKDIFEEAFKCLKKSGKILYATCSIFKEENEDQINYFLNKYPLELEKNHSWLPQKDGKDGFFGSILKKIN
jgi:16S rRNA (cytosine967-C5)-methyltransferase